MADIFTGMTIAQKQALLAKAQQAYMDLMTGGKPQKVTYSQGTLGMRSVEYTPATIGNLQQFIANLQMSLGLRCRRRGIGIIF